MRSNGPESWLRAAKAISRMSPRKPPKKEPFRAWKEVKRQARERIGTPPATRREESPRRKPPKHKKREIEVMEDA